MVLGRKKEMNLILGIKYKLHTIIDVDYQLLRRIKTTTASLHDSQVDLSKECEVVYRDRGYFGAKAKGYECKEV